MSAVVRYAPRAARRGCGSSYHLSASRLLLGTPTNAPRNFVRRKNCAGETCLEDCPRHTPDGARRFVLSDHSATASDHPAGALNPVPTHPGEHDAERALSEHRADRCKHRVERGHATAEAATAGQPNHFTPLARFDGEVRIAGRDENAVWLENHPVDCN